MYPTPKRPGYGAFVWQQAEQLRQLGHTVDVVNILGFRSKLNYVKAAVEVLQRTRGAAYDIVHAHYGLAAVPAWFRRRAPLVLTLHGGDLLGGRAERFCTWVIWRFADAVIVVSEQLRRRIPGIVIPCGVDLKVFTPRDRHEARARLGWRQDKVFILFPFDPVRPVKRWDLARAAVDELAKQGTPAELVTVCSVDNREMPWYYSAADVMILCSDREGSPTSVKEALACGLPVVATDVGDLREILTGVPGTRICTQQVRDIVRSLREVLSENCDGSVDRRAAVARYDQAATVERILGVYDGVRLRLQIDAKRRSSWVHGLGR
jgi:glycosyltransferase involved in cell wall biosynthesis